jgi:ribosomal protein L11 methyltransferase
MPYRVDVCRGADTAFEHLIDLGALDVDLCADGTISAIMPDYVGAEQIANALQLRIRDISVSSAIARDSSVWVLSTRPVRVGGRELKLVDSDAFGTGLHPTTALCLEAIDEILRTATPEAVLDVGTGSGVLAIAALMLGVPSARAIDIDQRALTIAAENAIVNGVGDRLEVSCGGAHTVTGTWPLVVANVLAAPLIDMAPELVRRIGHEGQLVLSGIAESVAADVDHAYRRLGMRRVQMIARDGWIALVFQASW